MRHGGRLADARAAYPHAPLPWLDLSTGVNPFPWRRAVFRNADATRLPDPADTAALEAAAAENFGARPAQVVALPGSELGIRLLPHILGAQRIGIVSPTYGSHAEAWQAAGRDVRAIDAQIEPFAHDAVVLVNPNNPDGRTLTASEIVFLAERMQASGGWLIVDEASADATPDLSVAFKAGGRLIVLRSFGKFYGLAGLRLGFVVCDPALADKVRTLVGDWPVNAAAVAAGRAAYADTAWKIRVHKRLARAAKTLSSLLEHNSFTVIGGTSLFRLVTHTRAARCFATRAEAGCWCARSRTNPSGCGSACRQPRIGLGWRGPWTSTSASPAAMRAPSSLRLPTWGPT